MASRSTPTRSGQPTRTTSTPTTSWRTDGYYYSPAFEFVVGWGRLLPFEVFVAIWRAILLGILVYLAGPFTIFVLFTVPVASEINAGNIQLMLALAVVLGFRWQATWAFVVLTKLTPGIGALWFALRRQWRAFGDRGRGDAGDRGRLVRPQARPPGSTTSAC